MSKNEPFICDQKLRSGGRLPIAIRRPGQEDGSVVPDRKRPGNTALTCTKILENTLFGIMEC